MLKFQLAMMSGVAAILPGKYAYIFNIMSSFQIFSPEHKNNYYYVFSSKSATTWYIND